MIHWEIAIKPNGGSLTDSKSFVRDALKRLWFGAREEMILSEERIPSLRAMETAYHSVGFVASGELCHQLIQLIEKYKKIKIRIE